MALTGRQFTLTAGDFAATVVEVGAGLRQFTHAGTEVTAGYRKDQLPPRCDGAVLIPWPNRLRDGRYTFDGVSYQVPVTELPNNNANHGLARWSRWAATAQTTESVTLSLDVVPQSGWPFELTAVVTYALDATNGLSVQTSVRNNGATRAPFGAGFHPYLSVRGHSLDEVTLQIPASTRLVTDAVQVPVGTADVAGTDYDFRSPRALGALRLDDAVTDLSYVDGRGSVVVSTPTASSELWFDESFGFLQVFTADVLADARPAVAVEPMTCPANAFNSGDGLIVLEPGQEWSGAWGVRPLALG